MADVNWSIGHRGLRSGELPTRRSPRLTCS